MKIRLVRWTELLCDGVARQRGQHGVVVKSVIESRKSGEEGVMKVRVEER